MVRDYEMPYYEHVPGYWPGLGRLFMVLAAHLRNAAESGAALPPGVEPDPRIVVPLALVDYGRAGPRELSLTNELVDPTLFVDLDAYLDDPGRSAQLVGQGRLAELGLQLALDRLGANGRSPVEARVELARRLVAAAGLSEARVRLLEWLRPDLCLRAVRLLTQTGIARNESWRPGTTRLRDSDFAVRFSALLAFYVLLSIAPCARVSAVLLGGWSWGIQGWLGIVFLAVNAGRLTFFALARRGNPEGRRDEWLRRDIWTGTVWVVPLGSCIALVEWCGTWPSTALGVALFAGVIGLLAPLVTRRAREKFLDEGLPSRVLPLVQE